MNRGFLRRGKDVGDVVFVINASESVLCTRSFFCGSYDLRRELDDYGENVYIHPKRVRTFDDK